LNDALPDASPAMRTAIWRAELYEAALSLNQSLNDGLAELVPPEVLLNPEGGLAELVPPARPSRPSREFHYDIPCPLQWAEAPRGHSPAKHAEPAKEGRSPPWRASRLCVSNPCCDPTATFVWNGRLEPAANRDLTMLTTAVVITAL
jgi:hypothetical protein